MPGGLQQGEEQGHGSAVQPSALHDMGGAGAHFLTLLALHNSQLNLGVWKQLSSHQCKKQAVGLWGFRLPLGTRVTEIFITSLTSPN